MFSLQLSKKQMIECLLSAHLRKTIPDISQLSSALSDNIANKKQQELVFSDDYFSFRDIKAVDSKG